MADPVAPPETPPVAPPVSAGAPGPTPAAAPIVVPAETPAAAPAASSPEPPVASPAEGKPAALSEAKPAEGEKLAEPAKAEAAKAVEAPAEAKTDAPPVEPPKLEPLPKPAYEALKIPDGIKLDDARVGQFSDLMGDAENKIAADPAQAHAVIQDLRQQIADLYIEEVKDAAQRHARLQHDTWGRVTEGWMQEFRDDPDIGKNREQTTLNRCGAMFELYGQRFGADREKGLRSALKLTGAEYNPDVIRFVHWASSFAVERGRPVPARQGAAPPQTKAEKLYPTLRQQGQR